ncbi:hypothetical protein OU995_01430 [Roseateles sp. SL47]|uniref:hypothetical protein n=1 Tax=Roseateles sp. SL47 TaxID=2995138 RepID=UPI0022703CC5|nr:hypothetical protein [Roseateles sp. SL47]WAC73439.1 hypothetical protein OU995_01430 [Roseateles sp. SL47]
MKRRQFLTSASTAVAAAAAALPIASPAAAASGDKVLRVGFQKGGLLLQLQQRVRFGARLLDDTIAADQQRMADAFAAQRLIPRPVRVREAWAPALYPGKGGGGASGG